METFLIVRKLSPLEVDDLNQRLAASPGKVIGLPGFIRKEDFPQTVIEYLPASLTQTANQNLLKRILHFGDKIIENTSISERLNLNGLPLWHYQRFRIYFKLQSVFLLREAIFNLQNQPGKIICYCPESGAEFSDIRHKDVEIIRPKEPVKAGINYRAVFNYGIFFIIRTIAGLLMPPHLKGKKHLIIDRSIKQYCRHLITLKPKLDNYNLSPLFDLAGQCFLIISEVEPPKVRGAAKFRLQKGVFDTNGRRKNTINGEYLLFRGILSPGLHGKRKKMLRELSTSVELIDSGPFTREELLIFKAFANLKSTNSFFILKHLAYRKFFTKHAFQTISSIDENSPATRCILDAASLHGSKTIGIQHGNIGNTQPAYIYTPLDNKNHIMADLTLVWGTYWKDFLVSEANYNAEAIKITGQLRTDIIPKLLKHSSEFKAKFSGKPKLAVFASQPIPDASLRWQAAFDVFKAFADVKDTDLVVKLHPAEKEAIPYYTEIARQAGVLNPRFLYNVDLYELIAACDLLITCYSTVGGEAVYFGKPLIILDHHHTDLLGYYAEEVAWQATDAESLASISKEILQGKLIPDKGKYETFIQKYAFSIDGKATKRALEAIIGEESGISH